MNRTAETLNMKWAGIFLGLMYLVFLNAHLDVRAFNAHDPATYLDKALALWRGSGYGEGFANVFMPVTAQPIGFSLLLAPVVGLAGINFIVLKLFMVLLAGLSAVSFYQLFKYFLSSSQKAFMATLLIMASPVVFGLSHRILADIPLFLLTALGLWTLDRYLKESVSLFSIYLWLAAAAMGSAYLIKQTAVGVMFGGWFLLLHPSWRNAAVLRKLVVYTLISSVPIFIWHYWASKIPDDLWYWTTPSARDFFYQDPLRPEHLISISEFVTRMRHNLVWGMANNLATVLIAPFYFLEGSLFGFLLSLPVVVWLFSRWVMAYLKEPSVLEGFVFFSLLLLLVKYLGMAARYVALVYPAVLIYAFRGLASFSKQFQKRIFSLLLVAAVGTTFFTAVDQWKNPYGSQTLRDYVGAAGEAKKLFPKATECIAPLLSHWQVLTGHQCFWYKTDSELQDFSASSHYVVGLSDTAPKDIEPFKDVERDALSHGFKISRAVNVHPDLFEKVFENQTFALYKVKSETS